MKKVLGFALLVMSLLLTLPEHVQGQKKDQNNKNMNVVKATAQDYKGLERLKEITGIIGSADAGLKSISLRIDNPSLQPNQGKTGGNPYRRGKGAGRVSVTVVHNYKEFDLDVDAAVVVKKLFVTVDYDDKGYLKANDEQSKELRAKGYIAAKLEDVRSGNVAKLVLVMPKREGKDEGVGNVTRPTIKAVYLLKEGTPVQPTNLPEKKKKN